MTNRIPLLEILNKHFIEVEKDKQFQIIMTTYDKVWYELVRNYFGTEKWKYIEIYTKSLNGNDFEIPIIFNENGYLEKAKYYLTEKDYKASAVYIRTEFERIVKLICNKLRLLVIYKKNQKEVTSDDFWLAIETQTDLDPVLIREIGIHRGVVMNPFSHYDLEKPEFKRELEDCISSIEKLIAIENDIKKIKTFDQLENKIEELGIKLKKKVDLVKFLGAKIKEKKNISVIPSD